VIKEGLETSIIRPLWIQNANALAPADREKMQTNGNWAPHFSLGITWNEIQQCKPSSSQQPSSRRNLGW